MQVLIVEDSMTLGHIFEKFLREMNHDVIVVNSGEEALQSIETIPVDMILMDVDMPGLDGLETTKLIRESMDHWLPIIFVSGRSEEDDFRKGIDAGGDDYLIKPVSRVILQTKIKAMERILSMQKELNSLYEKLESFHRYDSLTQIYNIGAFKEYANEMWNIVGRQSRCISVLMIDVDHFKEYNDYYGHPAGDSCLKKVGQVLKNILQRSGDLCGRYGGEEFIAVLSSTDAEGAKKVGEDIRSEIENLQVPHARSTVSPVVTVSVGVSVVPHSNHATLEEMIKHADIALYKAKRGGRNRVFAEEYLFRVHKNILVLNADNTFLLTLRDLLKDRCQIVTVDNNEECFELIDAIKAEMIFINASNCDVDTNNHTERLFEKIKRLEIPLVCFSSAHNPDLGTLPCTELIDVLDEEQLRKTVARYFPE